jgi:hypothetical protein
MEVMIIEPLGKKIGIQHRKRVIRNEKKLGLPKGNKLT